jgi:DNA primase
MGKASQPAIKYSIKADFLIDGLVERHDVIGAIFGQTEGLLGEDLDLKELQKCGKIGRIEVEVKRGRDKTTGTITIPSSLTKAKTAMIAASLETIEKVGPYDAEIKVKEVRDVREAKRKFIAERARELLQLMKDEETSVAAEIAERVEKASKPAKVQSWKGLPCGPDIERADEIIIVEGRADVLNLLKHGIANVISADGAKIPDALTELTEQKITTLFIDGDRGGKLLLTEALNKVDVDYVAIAPEGKEVEELEKKEIYRALRSKVSAQSLRK